VIDFFLVFAPKYLPALLRGALVTIEVTCLSMIFGTLLGLLAAIARLSGFPGVVHLIKTYVEICRGLPVIVLLLIIYFTLPQFGIFFPAFWAGVTGLSINLGAYLSEVFRAAILAVDVGQREAAISIGMSETQAYTRIILPQAFVVALPTVGGYFIAVLKDCSLVSFITVNELLRQGTIIIAATFESMRVYLLVGIIYLAMSSVSARAINWAERRLKPKYLRS
jgi:His/Glu/Gln/Arg/opine family amino acid ABC transporter permease subunit